MADSAIRFPVRIKLARTEIPILCAALADSLRGRPGDVVVCEVTGPGEPDVVLVEALARLRLTAHRHGRRLRLTGAGPALLSLLALLGLDDLLLQVGGQAEQREQPRRVEEVVDAGDPPV
ncbi:STAS domain-containing protein [Actinoplanes sp. NPDC049802]|uniref:STAS domain-containing protein n=1 Tax=Actinoplanes sp. NPDC049802 TaxID=3154742 RepID=UPI0033F3B6EB